MPRTTTIAETLRLATEKLRAAAVPNDVLDAQTLLAEALGCDRTYLIVNFNQALDADTLEKYDRLITRRAAGEPLQYITGRQEFYGLEFEVTPDVLIPRPETELLVGTALELLKDAPSPLLCDVGAGSGCVAVALLHARGDARALALDISPEALRVAARNAERHGVSRRMLALASDCLDALRAE